jgi:hypothetical protein
MTMIENAIHNLYLKIEAINKEVPLFDLSAEQAEWIGDIVDTLQTSDEFKQFCGLKSSFINNLLSQIGESKKIGHAVGIQQEAMIEKIVAIDFSLRDNLENRARIMLEDLIENYSGTDEEKKKIEEDLVLVDGCNRIAGIMLQIEALQTLDQMTNSETNMRLIRGNEHSCCDNVH